MIGKELTLSRNICSIQYKKLMIYQYEGISMRSWMDFSYVDYETQKRYPKVSAY